MRNISPCLWFDGQAEEAMNFYVSIFDHSKILGVSRYGENAPMPEGTVLSANFLLRGEEFIVLNGGPQYKFSPATSLVVHCADQAEVDYYWEKLTAGGEEQPCGWLQDKFGVSWQIVPRVLGELMSGPDPEINQRVAAALMGMKKIDIATLKQAQTGN